MVSTVAQREPLVVWTKVEGGGLADEGELVFGGVVFGEVFGAGLMGFLAHEGDEVDGDGEVGENVFVLKESKEHRGHGAFGVGGAATPDFSVAFFGAERLDGHAVDGDGVEVGSEEDAGAVVGTRGAGNEVGAVGEDFVEGDGEAPRGEQGGEVGSHFGFARKGGVGDGVGVDGGNADEVLEEGGDGHGGRFF